MASAAAATAGVLRLLLPWYLAGVAVVPATAAATDVPGRAFDRFVTIWLENEVMSTLAPGSFCPDSSGSLEYSRAKTRRPPSARRTLTTSNATQTSKPWPSLVSSSQTITA